CDADHFASSEAELSSSPCRQNGRDQDIITIDYKKYAASQRDWAEKLTAAMKTPTKTKRLARRAAPSAA
ncbi:MAG: hypothetical protein VX107_19150, partial [Pseudomonadota bacterium]|nr:hypothetical protein [Pseudomonadota bacterium]